MTSPEERIKEIARSKSLDAEDAARLLEAVRSKPKDEPRESALKNPFARFSGEITTTAGVAVSALGLLASRFGVRFDGALDLHTASTPVPFRLALLEQLVAFPLTAIVFWAIARIAARHVRLIDVVGVVGLSRAPSTLIAVPIAWLSSWIGPGHEMNAALAALLVCSLTAIGAHLYLLFTGFRTVSGLRGGRSVALFIAAVVVAETVSKLALHFA